MFKWSPSFFKNITNIWRWQLLTNKIYIVKLFGVLEGSKDNEWIEPLTQISIIPKMHIYNYQGGKSAEKKTRNLL